MRGRGGVVLPLGSAGALWFVVEGFLSFSLCSPLSDSVSLCAAVYQCVSVHQQSVMKILVLLLALLTVSECDRKITGRRGLNITLPCNYDIKTNGPTAVCWGRGPVPASGCSNQLLATDGHNVIGETRASSRYQLQGRLDEGDVSLTIVNATEEDDGVYGCRVQIFGLFNDEKHHVNLTVKRAPRLTSTPSSDLTSSSSDSPQTTAAAPTAGHMTSAHSTLTAASMTAPAKEVAMLVLVSVAFLLLVLVTAGVFIIMNRRWKKQKVPSLPPQMQMQSPTQVEENIYHIDTNVDGDYEMCP
ncbi:hypothetical protein OJAV_G00135500 [Oryzias javanicus]|uniref:Ig-like domain-containing protein n=1 Tax=Oryzias javanicus TaxID=123683 RepID=A0A3S2PCR5_ORYJA|nr:hypothetical protein OJAV_G00135500 [Oryzias javanicus]